MRGVREDTCITITHEQLETLKQQPHKKGTQCRDLCHMKKENSFQEICSIVLNNLSLMQQRVMEKAALPSLFTSRLERFIKHGR